MASCFEPEPEQENRFRFDPHESSTQSLFSSSEFHPSNGNESPFGSFFGRTSSLTNGNVIFISSVSLTIIISAFVLISIVFITVIITLAVMLTSCSERSAATLIKQDVVDFCSSFHLNVELNNIGKWTTPQECKDEILKYVSGNQYINDVNVAVDSARTYLRSFSANAGQKNALVMDIDETAISNAHLWKKHMPENGVADESVWSIFTKCTTALPLAPVLELYNELKSANWTIFFISERPESTFNSTVQNLIESGYAGWESLILRPADDIAQTVQEYKSMKRIELEEKGYQIVSVIGDQWSDIIGPATGLHNFKIPNPIYQIV